MKNNDSDGYGDGSNEGWFKLKLILMKVCL